MKYFANLLALSACTMIIISSCNDNNSASPYDEIFSQKPFAAITDSIKKDPENDRFSRLMSLF